MRYSVLKHLDLKHKYTYGHSKEVDILISMC